MDEGQVAVACLSLARGAPATPELAGAWLVSYDPEGNDGNGDASWSHDPAAALLLTPQEWGALSNAVPANRPRWPDGKPNRPITMFDLMVVPVKPGELPSLLPMPPPAPLSRPSRKPISSSGCPGSAGRLRPGRHRRRSPRARPTSCGTWG